MVYAARIAGVALAYYLAAKLGLGLAFTTPSVTAVWPPTGIALAAVILGGSRMWPGVALGAFLANAWTDVPLYTALGITIGNTLEALVGATLLRRLAGFRPSLERVRDVVALAVFGAIVSTTVSATIGVLSLLAGNEVAAGDFGSVWRTWWLGDMGGDLVVAPALLVAVTHWPHKRLPGRALEAAGLALLLAGTTALVFTREAPILYLVYPVMIAIALRFWQPGAAVASLLVATIAIPLTESDIGPFSGNSPDDRLLLAQLFVGTGSVTALLLAAVVTERQRAEAALGRIAGTLQESLLPTEMPNIPGIETAVYYRPAGERQIVGGDFFDIFPGEDGSWGVVVGDMVGKGPEAAAATALARYTLRAAAGHERWPSRILQQLHAALRRQTSDQSCTVVYLRLEQGDGGRARVTLSSAGHPLPLALRTDGAVETIGDPANMLGWPLDVPLDVPPSDATLDLAPGESLFLYTDGLTDAYAPARIVHQEELAAALRSTFGLSASEIVSGVRDTIIGDVPAEPRDDVLLLVLRAPAEAPSVSAPERPARETPRASAHRL